MFDAISTLQDQLFVPIPQFKKEEARDFVKMLLKRNDKIRLVLDKAAQHTSILMRKFIAENQECLEARFFPTAWPELNATEKCWGVIKREPFMYNTIIDKQIAIANFLKNHTFTADIKACMFQTPIKKLSYGQSIK